MIKPFAFAIAAFVALSAAPAFAACDPGERIDNSTATDAKRKIEAAGYQNVRDLKKGCDNYWHAIVTRDGMRIRVVLSPQGEVMREGD